MPIYHERQTRQLCLKHTINALIQLNKVTEAELNAICDQLDKASGVSSSTLGWRRLPLLGNYDVNVLDAVLVRHGLDLKWHPTSDAGLVQLDLARPGLLGLVLNTPSDWLLARLVGARHWLALRRINGMWWNLDSKLPAPECFAAGSEDSGEVALREFLVQQVQRRQAVLLLVYDAAAGEGAGEAAGVGQHTGGSTAVPAGEAAAANVGRASVVAGATEAK